MPSTSTSTMVRGVQLESEITGETVPFEHSDNPDDLDEESSFGQWHKPREDRTPLLEERRGQCHVRRRVRY